MAIAKQKPIIANMAAIIANNNEKSMVFRRSVIIIA
jgi:hypothetical protein